MSVDTVRWRFRGKLNPQFADEFGDSKGWKWSARVGLGRDEWIDAAMIGAVSRDRVQAMATHESGLRVGTDDKNPGYMWCEVSLPKLLFGRNDKLITTQAELDDATAAMLELVFQVATVDQGIGYSRIDVCWQFPGSTREWIVRLRNINHPRIRKAAVVHEGTGLVLQGSNFLIRVYDKGAERRAAGDHDAEPGKFVRVEMQHRSKRAHEVAAPPAAESHVVDDALSVVETSRLDLRKILAAFVDNVHGWAFRWTSDVHAQGLPAVLVRVLQDDHIPADIRERVIEHYLADKSPRTVSRTKCALRKMIVAPNRWTWLDLMRSAGLLDALDASEPA